MAENNSKPRIVEFAEGTIILKEGEINLDMFKIIKGNAEVYVGYGTKQETLIGIIGPQACFGEFGLLLHKPAIYTVIAFSDIFAMRITEGEMGDFVQENHKNIIDIMRNMANTMMTMSLQIKLLLEEIEEGKKPDTEAIKELQKTIRRNTVLRPSNMLDSYEFQMNYLDKKI